MNELEVRKVPFMGAELMAARDNDGQIWAGVSYICRGIGLSKNEKDRQVKNVQSDRVLMKGCGKFDAGVFDRNNSALALKLDYHNLHYNGAPAQTGHPYMSPYQQLEYILHWIEVCPPLLCSILGYQMGRGCLLHEAYPQFYPGWLRQDSI